MPSWPGYCMTSENTASSSSNILRLVVVSNVLRKRHIRRTVPRLASWPTIPWMWLSPWLDTTPDCTIKRSWRQRSVDGLSAPTRTTPALLELADRPAELDGSLSRMRNAPDVLESESVSSLFALDETDSAQLRRFEFATRMLFSLLVDADRLDSEKFEQEYRRQRSWERPRQTLHSGRLIQLLEDFRRMRSKTCSNRRLTQLRNDVFEACRSKGQTSQQGFFTLTVPTGGAKTISSMVFALAHAESHDLRRVIVVIPYLSIIEQNAREYRTIFGADQVLEHHCAVDVGKSRSSTSNDSDEPSESNDLERTMENWDVPIVVTTSVQFIETLFAASPGRARRLHNIARSVVVFDEVQTLPTHLLEPTLDMLRTLKEHFGVSVVFCSATQPAFQRSVGLKHGFQADELEEIAPNVAEIYAQLRRVQYHVVPSDDRWDWDRLAQEMTQRPQALCIVNLRQHAADAWAAVRRRLIECGREEEAKQAVFHLSSAMCPAHRLDLLGLSETPLKNNIKQRLREGKPCWVVSTQLIEAGVDIDFPTVFRAMGPLDSIVQAAGRCNREGSLVDKTGNPMRGEVVIFQPEDDGLPMGIYRQATSITPGYLADTEGLASDPALFADYFTELFQMTSTDRARRGEKTIQELRAALRFRTVAERAKVIPDNTTSVIVPYRRAAKLVQRIRRIQRVDTRVLRRLQRSMVSLRHGPGSLLQQLQEEGRLEPLLPEIEIPVLDADCYDRHRGVIFRSRSPEDLIV